MMVTLRQGDVPKYEPFAEGWLQGEQIWGRPEKGDPMKAKIPARRFGRPVEVADMILYLASPASDLVCGQDLLIDGGFTAA